MRKFLGFLVVLLVLLVGADFGLRYLAARQIGDAVQTRLTLAERPDVAIAGFPFLLQVVQGDYRQIRATLPPTDLDQLTGVGVTVVLDGVRLPLSDAVSGTVENITADSGEVRLTVPTTSIAAAVGLAGLTLTGENGDLILGVTVTVLGQQFPVTARLDAAITGGALVLKSGSATGAGITLPAEVIDALTTLVDLTVPLDRLPFTLTGGSVSVVGGDLVVDASATDLDLAVR